MELLPGDYVKEYYYYIWIKLQFREWIKQPPGMNCQHVATTHLLPSGFWNLKNVSIELTSSKTYIKSSTNGRRIKQVESIARSDFTKKIKTVKGQSPATLWLLGLSTMHGLFKLGLVQAGVGPLWFKIYMLHLVCVAWSYCVAGSGLTMTYQRNLLISYIINIVYPLW